MSLINQMLRDLDARHAPPVDRAALPSAVHVQAQEGRKRRWPALALALLVVGAGSWSLLVGRAAPPPQALPQRIAAAVPAQAEAPAPVAPRLAAPEILPEPPVPPAPEASVPPAPAPAKSAAATPAVPKAATATPRATPAGAQAASPAPGAMRVETTLHGADAKTAAEKPPLPALPSADAVPGQASIDKRPRTSAANDTAENEYRKAIAALRRGATSEAVDGLHAALRADKRHVSARQALLSLLVEQQQWGEAQALVEEGLALDPAQTGWATVQARLQLESGKLAEAAETLARHAGYAEQNAEYQAFHALLLQKLKRPGEAAARYRAALAVKPTESRWWYGLGMVLEADQRPQEAREAFLRARETGNLPPELAAANDQRLRLPPAAAAHRD